VSHRPKVSVLLPVRDAAPWLDEALDSLVAQTYADFEIVAVDDGSRDASREILARHAQRDRRLRCLETSRDDRGLVAALNLGLRAACGAYVARMDADDVALPERLGEQVGVLDADFRCTAVTCRVEGFPAEAVLEGMQRYIAWQNALAEPHEIRRERFVESPIVAPSLMIRTDFLRGVLGGWQDHGWPEDWDLVLRAFEAGATITRFPRVLHRWRQHEAQATRTDTRYGIDRLLRARAHYLARHLAHVARAREIWLFGAGPVGKALAEALAHEGMRVAGFAEVDRRKIGNRIRRAGHWWPVISMSEWLAGRTHRFAVAAVGRPGARARIREWLTASGAVEEGDFIAAA
jgi:glycosyltransferase involved in cell wall biosynthesis